MTKSPILTHVGNKERTRNRDVNSFSRALSPLRLITEESEKEWDIEIKE